MAAPSLLRQLGIRYIEAALEKAAAVAAEKRPHPMYQMRASALFNTGMRDLWKQHGYKSPDEVEAGLATDQKYYEALRGLYDKHMAPYNKTAADIRPGDAKPPAEVDRQASSLATVVNQLRKPELKTPIEEENAPRVLTPQK